MRFESQTHTQNAHIDRYSTRYDQAPVVALAKGRWMKGNDLIKYNYLTFSYLAYIF